MADTNQALRSDALDRACRLLQSPSFADKFIALFSLSRALPPQLLLTDDKSSKQFRRKLFAALTPQFFQFGFTVKEYGSYGLPFPEEQHLDCFRLVMRAAAAFSFDTDLARQLEPAVHLLADFLFATLGGNQSIKTETRSDIVRDIPALDDLQLENVEDAARCLHAIIVGSRSRLQGILLVDVLTAAFSSMTALISLKAAESTNVVKGDLVTGEINENKGDAETLPAGRKERDAVSMLLSVAHYIFQHMHTNGLFRHISVDECKIYTSAIAAVMRLGDARTAHLAVDCLAMLFAEKAELSEENTLNIETLRHLLHGLLRSLNDDGDDDLVEHNGAVFVVLSLLGRATGLQALIGSADDKQTFQTFYLLSKLVAINLRLYLDFYDAALALDVGLSRVESSPGAHPSPSSVVVDSLSRSQRTRMASAKYDSTTQALQACASCCAMVFHGVAMYIHRAVGNAGISAPPEESLDRCMKLKAVVLEVAEALLSHLMNVATSPIAAAFSGAFKIPNIAEFEELEASLTGDVKMGASESQEDDMVALRYLLERPIVWVCVETLAEFLELFDDHETKSEMGLRTQLRLAAPFIIHINASYKEYTSFNHCLHQLSEMAHRTVTASIVHGASAELPSLALSPVLKLLESGMHAQLKSDEADDDAGEIKDIEGPVASFLERWSLQISRRTALFIMNARARAKASKITAHERDIVAAVVRSATLAASIGQRLLALQPAEQQSVLQCFAHLQKVATAILQPSNIVLFDDTDNIIEAARCLANTTAYKKSDGE